ncbi:bifunctional precorrin-2 dehydrogenase/sirohydrochlorin ferrochelatase [Methanoplanus sp. FWC-SCC4]|uniref:precorrin-2 dehydrogenase n=2 Tax=Methanochimaera problematica TaxID=2609417 RepID=A0AA97FBG4_9EURY|nr:bifunctional precorrin-2 dehydrogenase/sirohydrochlorin ferrochelatase [Methanoplanus sp. FWC-SCC4]WOF15894.1 bifunctional precorrin-2 dehydrogenase/sirohydrochlorin ferrochelatase [Methanoplanus sp. FWC-SCC4]
MIPLIHEMKGKRIVIFGGGDVGFRKAAYFYPEAEVVVVSRRHLEEIQRMGVLCIEMDLNTASEDDIKKVIGDSVLIVASTSDRTLNNRIGVFAKELGIHFNNADGEPGDIIIPSKISGENYIIAISTGGKSPGMSRYIRLLIEEKCPNIDRMIELQNEVREYLKTTIPEQKKRNEILRKIIYDDKVWSELEINKDFAIKYIKGKYLQ